MPTVQSRRVPGRATHTWSPAVEIKVRGKQRAAIAPPTIPEILDDKSNAAKSDTAHGSGWTRRLVAEAVID